MRGQGDAREATESPPLPGSPESPSGPPRPAGGRPGRHPMGGPGNRDLNRASLSSRCNPRDALTEQRAGCVCCARIPSRRIGYGTRGTPARRRGGTALGKRARRSRSPAAPGASDPSHVRLPGPGPREATGSPPPAAPSLPRAARAALRQRPGHSEPPEATGPRDARPESRAALCADSDPGLRCRRRAAPSARPSCSGSRSRSPDAPAAPDPSRHWQSERTRTPGSAGPGLRGPATEARVGAPRRRSVRRRRRACPSGQARRPKNSRPEDGNHWLLMITNNQWGRAPRMPGGRRGPPGLRPAPSRPRALLPARGRRGRRRVWAERHRRHSRAPGCLPAWSLL